ncbi:MAG TPA: hypothetical protein VF691_07675 [Cytophagaceae bacterium]|jgi:hypothetical protein
MKGIKLYLPILIVLTTILFFLPIEVPFTVYSTGKVFAVREWMVGRNRDGRIISTLKNNSLGLIDSYGGKEFQEGNIYEFYLDPNLSSKKYVKKGEIIGQSYSNEINKLLIQLEGELSIQKASLMVSSTGQKAQSVKEVEASLNLAKEKLNIQEKLLKRSKKLFADSLIAPQQYDLTLNEYETCRINVELAEAQLQSISTGEKPEHLKLVREKIRSLQSQINNLKDRSKFLTLTAPFSGVLQQKKGALSEVEIIVNLIDTSSYIIITPIQVKELKYLAIGQIATLALFNSGCEMKGRISHIDNAIQIVGGKQAAFVTAEILEKCPDTMPGIFAQTVIDCEKVTIMAYCKRIFSELFYR